jgi:hypothetical protein
VTFLSSVRVADHELLHLLVAHRRDDPPSRSELRAERGVDLPASPL